MWVGTISLFAPHAKPTCTNDTAQCLCIYKREEQLHKRCGIHYICVCSTKQFHWVTKLNKVYTLCHCELLCRRLTRRHFPTCVYSFVVFVDSRLIC